MMNYREGLRRISIGLSVVGFVVGLHWAYQEWGKIDEHRRFISQFEKAVNESVGWATVISTPDLPKIKSAPVPTSTGPWEHYRPKPLSDLGRKVKAKYPGAYDDLADDALGRGIKAKFPRAYDDFVEANPPSSSELEIEVPGLGSVTFPQSMTKQEILEAAIRLRQIERPTWYWFASLFVGPLLGAFAPMASYRAIRWIVAGFLHEAADPAG